MSINDGERTLAILDSIMSITETTELFFIS